MAISKAEKTVRTFIREGWEFAGDLIEALDMESDTADKTLDFENYEYTSLTIAFKRKRGEHAH